MEQQEYCLSFVIDRLTVVDSDGVTDSTLAIVRAMRPVDLPPVAHAGPNQTLTLPVNHIILSGSESSDDHGITDYSWTFCSSSQDIDPTMQVRSTTNILQKPKW